MMLAVAFWLGVVLMIHSYVWYPMILQLWSKGKHLSRTNLMLDEQLPNLVVVLSVYNGERLIREKINGIFQSDYPKSRIFAWVGSDCSTDKTNEFLIELAQQYPNLHIELFNERKGKIKVVNELIAQVKESGMETPVVVMTDLSAMFEVNCFRELAQMLNQPDIGLVGAHILKGDSRKDGISLQEKTYYEGELQMKYQEGVIAGVSMGAFGACYAIRLEDMQPIPANFLVDDFYMTMQLLQQGKKAVYSQRARVFMDVPNQSAVEFQRKARIAAGNFQNLQLFWPMLMQFSWLAFAFWSHKVIRWFGPFLILTTWLCSLVLLPAHWIYALAFFTQSFFMLTPLINYLLEKAQIHLKLLKFVAHFYLMNLGMLAGFLRFTKGIQNNVWTPTQR